MNLTLERSHDAKAAVATFLSNGAPEGDYVTLISTGGAAWWTERMESGREKRTDEASRRQRRRLLRERPGARRHADRVLGKAESALVTEMDIRGLEFSEGAEGRQVAEVQVYLVVAHRVTGELYRYDQDITLNLRPATRERLDRL